MPRTVSRSIASAMVFAGLVLTACSSAPGDTSAPSIEHAETTVDPLDSTGSCSCSGMGLGGPVTVSCGQTTCGTDSNTYLCNAPGGVGGFTLEATGCGPCQCSGTNLAGPVTVSCGEPTIGTDDATYVCTAPGGAAGWKACTCSGTGLHGPVKVDCGHTTCGTDSNTYACTGAGVWAQQATGCVEASNAMADGYFTLAEVEGPVDASGTDPQCSISPASGPYPTALAGMGCTKTMLYKLDVDDASTSAYVWMCPTSQLVLPTDPPIPADYPAHANAPTAPKQSTSRCVGSPPLGWSLVVEEDFVPVVSPCKGGCPAPHYPWQ